MKLRLILIVLSLLAIFSASTGGYFYYTSLQEAAMKGAEMQAAERVATINKNVSAFLAEFAKPVRTLAGMKALQDALADDTLAAKSMADQMLDHFKNTLAADVCYLMNDTGVTIASSNRFDPDSFVGQNFSFRPYFQMAIHGEPATYLALGTTSGKRGVYFSHPISRPGSDVKTPAGVVVIKGAIQLIEEQLDFFRDEIVLVVDPRGVIFISNRQDWLYQLAWQLQADEIGKIADSRQFGTGPWLWTGLTAKTPNLAIDQAGREYLMHQVDLVPFKGWKIIRLQDRKIISQKASAPLLEVTRKVVLTLCVLVGLSVFFLYRQASREIMHRRAVEEALRESDERYRSLYHNTPAMLHSIDQDGSLVSVSRYWCEAMGFAREEVIGRRITDFYSESSRVYAETIVLPEFFAKGYCKDIAYQMIKKNGEIIDILLSAIADRDDAGRFVRTLAVSIDVTERNRAVEALRQAKEELSSYSRDLERQVSKRTREISNILKYTPDVVYVKDRQGRYVLVNSRFEELFGLSIDEVRGKTDYEVSPREVADQFRCHDQQVLEEGKPCRVEERIPRQDGMHTYLSVKFPMYDDDGVPSMVCGVSTDITAVKKAQDQLRKLSASIMASQEKERSAIARELHDELGQVLTALRMDAVWLLERLRDVDSHVARRAAAMCELIDTTIKEVRGIAIRLRPGVLDDLGLVDALEWFTTDFEKRSGITCVFEQEGGAELDDTVATAAYRITQEALTNVARHSGASKVEVALRLAGGFLELSVEDNGHGFEPLELSDDEGVGVAGMRERAVLAGGNLEVLTGKEQGVRVLFRVALASSQGGYNDKGAVGG